MALAVSHSDPIRVVDLIKIGSRGRHPRRGCRDGTTGWPGPYRTSGSQRRSPTARTSLFFTSLESTRLDSQAFASPPRRRDGRTGPNPTRRAWSSRTRPEVDDKNGFSTIANANPIESTPPQTITNRTGASSGERLEKSPAPGLGLDLGSIEARPSAVKDGVVGSSS